MNFQFYASWAVWQAAMPTEMRKCVANFIFVLHGGTILSFMVDNGVPVSQILCRSAFILLEILFYMRLYFYNF